MTNSLHVHPSMIFNNKPILLDLSKASYEIGIRLHFVDHLHNHIHGFSLCRIDYTGIYFDPEVREQITDVELDLNHEKDNILNIIGVDIL